jgi:hypothetical protein
MSNDDRPVRVANIDAATVQTIDQTHPMKYFREGAIKLEQTAWLAPALPCISLTSPVPTCKRSSLLPINFNPTLEEQHLTLNSGQANLHRKDPSEKKHGFHCHPNLHQRRRECRYSCTSLARVALHQASRLLQIVLQAELPCLCTSLTTFQLVCDHQERVREECQRRNGRCEMEL